MAGSQIDQRFQVPMSIRLTDGRGQSLKVNAWNWGVLQHAVACAKPPLFEDEDFVDRLRFGGVELDEGQVRKLHDFLKPGYPTYHPGRSANDV